MNNTTNNNKEEVEDKKNILRIRGDYYAIKTLKKDGDGTQEESPSISHCLVRSPSKIYYTDKSLREGNDSAGVIQSASEVGQSIKSSLEEPPPKVYPLLRPQIEPWLSTLFQSEHLSLLVGSGLSTAIYKLAGNKGTKKGLMEYIDEPKGVSSELWNAVRNAAGRSCRKSSGGDNKNFTRKKPNLEDQISAMNELINSLNALDAAKTESLVNHKDQINIAKESVSSIESLSENDKKILLNLTEQINTVKELIKTNLISIDKQSLPEISDRIAVSKELRNTLDGFNKDKKESLPNLSDQIDASNKSTDILNFLEIVKQILSSIYKDQNDAMKKLIGIFESLRAAKKEIPHNLEEQIDKTRQFIEKLIALIESMKDRLHLEKELQDILNTLITGILKQEMGITRKGKKAAQYLIRFLMSFASRPNSRNRLNIFTTNYDRIIEYGATLAGLHLLDRFVGPLNPILRSSRLDLDMHYHPPGIRGEPRYVEGVARFTKLHGSLDWIYDDHQVRRVGLSFGGDKNKTKGAEISVIYPNSDKDRETSYYPYVELMRDYAAGVCRPNSTLVLYGYSLGDEHINRVIEDMLTIPSTHLVIIAYEDTDDRIKDFCEEHDAGKDRITLLIGPNIAGLAKLVDHYLPVPALEPKVKEVQKLLEQRGWNT